MNRTYQTLLPLVCALVLVLIPLYSSWGQATTPSYQQDQTDRNGVNQNQDLNHDTNMPNQNTSPDQNSSDVNQSDTNQTDHNMKSDDQSTEQQKPSSTEQQKPASMPEATSEQDQNQNQNDKTDQTQSQDQDRSKGTDTDQKTAQKPGMPRTAGELPLLALIGTLSLVAAAGTRLLTRGQ